MDVLRGAERIQFYFQKLCLQTFSLFSQFFVVLFFLQVRFERQKKENTTITRVTRTKVRKNQSAIRLLGKQQEKKEKRGSYANYESILFMKQPQSGRCRIREECELAAVFAAKSSQTKRLCVLVSSDGSTSKKRKKMFETLLNKVYSRRRPSVNNEILDRGVGVATQADRGRLLLVEGRNCWFCRYELKILWLVSGVRSAGLNELIDGHVSIRSRWRGGTQRRFNFGKTANWARKLLPGARNT